MNVSAVERRRQDDRARRAGRRAVRRIPRGASRDRHRVARLTRRQAVVTPAARVALHALERSAQLNPVRHRIRPGQLELLPERDVVLAVVAEAQLVRIVGRCAGHFELPFDAESTKHLRTGPEPRTELHAVRVVDALTFWCRTKSRLLVGRPELRRAAVDRDRLARHRVVDRVGDVVRILQRIAVDAQDLVDGRRQVVEVAVEPAAGQRQLSASSSCWSSRPCSRFQVRGKPPYVLGAADPEVRRQRVEVDLAARPTARPSPSCTPRSPCATSSLLTSRHVKPRCWLSGWVVVLGDPGRPRQVVAVERVLDRRLRVAEEVVDHREARRAVGPQFGQVLDGRRTCVPARSARPAACRLDLRVERSRSAGRRSASAGSSSTSPARRCRRRSSAARRASPAACSGSTTVSGPGTERPWLLLRYRWYRSPLASCVW